jgi:hypothetical protein
MLKREMSIERADLAKREDDKSENADNARSFSSTRDTVGCCSMGK